MIIISGRHEIIGSGRQGGRHDLTVSCPPFTHTHGRK